MIPRWACKYGVDYKQNVEFLPNTTEHENILYLGVDFKQNVDFLPSPYARNQFICTNNQPKNIKFRGTCIISFYCMT